MGKSIWGCAPKAVRVGVCVSILALVFSEILHREPQSVALLIQLCDPIFPLYAPWAEDKALYVLRAAMLVPVGALLWRDAKHPLAWSGGILALALALEIVQVAFSLYYLRLYAVLACAAGLAVGAGFDAALRWAQGRSARGWALLCACACIAIGAEFVRTGGVPIYTAATGIGPVSISGYYWPLVVGVGLGKAVCLGMAARSLLRPWPAAALCTALLCLAWPTVFWEASSQGLEYLGAIALYAACAAGASALLCGAALGDEASLRPGRAA